MFEKTDGLKDLLRVLEIEQDDKYARIRCPACKWQPNASSRWCCYDPDQGEHPTGGCQTEWNTFDTGGRCPGCGHQWIRTTCLRCEVHSLHVDWYENWD